VVEAWGERAPSMDASPLTFVCISPRRGGRSGAGGSAGLKAGVFLLYFLFLFFWFTRGNAAAAGFLPSPPPRHARKC